MKIADYGKAITSYIESPTTAQKLKSKEKALLLAERDNVNTPDLEQSPDSFLRPGETLEDFDVTFRRPNSIGGRVRLSDGTKPSAEEAVTQQQIDYTKAKEKPFTLDQFKDKANIYVGALQNKSLPLADIKSALNKFTQKGIDDGTFTADEAIKVVMDLRSYYRDLAQKQRLRGVVEGIGDREEFSEGGIEKEYKGTLNYKELIKDKDFEDFWKARVDGTPMSEVRTGTFAGEDITYNSIQDVIKKYKLKSNDYEKIFNKVLDEVRTTERIRKGVKGFENKKPLVPATILSNLIKTFNTSYKPNVGTINTNEMEKLLNLTKGELSKIMSSIDRPYPEDKFRFTNPTATFIINKAAVLKNKLEKAGITYEKIGRDRTPLPPGRSGGVGYRFRLGKDKKTANKKIKELEKSKTFGFPEKKKKPSSRFRNIVSSLSKQSDEYKKYGYGRDRNAVTNLTTALNNSLRALNDKQLYKFINNNPAIKNLVTAVFDAQTGEIKNISLDSLTPDQIRDKTKFEVDHIRGRSTVDYDPATKKILDGLNIEYPKNLYIIPKAINDSVKRQVETFVKDNPNEKTKINKIKKYFEKNKLTYYNSVTGKYEGYKPSKSAVDLSHLGITKIEELKKLITGTFIDDKGIKRVKTGNPNKLIATLIEINKSRGETPLEKDIIKVKKHAESKGFKLNNFAGFLDFTQAGIDLPPAVKKASENILKAGGQTLRAFGKAAVVLDPIFAAQDFSKAVDTGVSGGESLSFTGQKFIQDLINLPRTLEDLAYTATEKGTFKNFGDKENRIFDYKPKTFADDFLKSRIEKTDPKILKARIAKRDFDTQVLPNLTMVDDIDIPASKEEIGAAKDAFMQEKDVDLSVLEKPKKSPFGKYNEQIKKLVF